MSNLKQPKFKFGDKLILPESRRGPPHNSLPYFEVLNIKYADIFDAYVYIGIDNRNYIYESDAELFVEPPRTKKVYQFIYKTDGRPPLMGDRLCDNQEQFREYLLEFNNVSTIEYIEIANTFEVPE
jgi:hypothetical protein